MVLILAFVSTFLSAALDCTPDLILSESAIPVGWGKVPHKCTPYPRRSPRFPTSHDLNLMRAYESNILGPSPIGFLQQRRTTVFLEGPRCLVRRSWAFLRCFFFPDLGFDTTKMVSELHFGQHISLWLGLILPCVDLFLYSPLLWTDNVVHGHVFHTFLQSLVAGSGA